MNEISSLHIVPRIAQEASGPSYSVQRLAGALLAADVKTRLHVLDPLPNKLLFQDVVSYHTVPGFWRLGLSPAMRTALCKEAAQADIVHNHSLWMMPNVYAGPAARRGKCCLVVSPRGTLSERALRRSRVLKRCMWLAGQARVLRDAHCLHATAQHEYEDIRRLGLEAPVAIIPNGVDIPRLPAMEPDQEISDPPRKVLFLGRIHPIKGIDVLLQIWKTLEREFPCWELRIVGPDNCGYLPKMQQLATTLGLQRARFLPPAYGPDKQAAYRSADLYVLPTHSENFGLTVAEALAHAVPVVVTKGAPWSGVEREACGWWPETNEDAIRQAMRTAMAIPTDQRRAMGARGREWMRHDFSWDRIGAMMAHTYQWLLRGGTVPAWMRID